MTSGDGTAVCSCFQIRHAAFRQQSHLIERDDLAVIGRRRWKTHHNLLKKRFTRRMENSNLFDDLGQRRNDGDAIKWHRGTGMSRQHEYVRGEREDLVQAVIERGSSEAGLLLVRFQVRSSDARWEEGITREKEVIVEQVAGAFHRVARRVQSRKQHGVCRERFSIANGGKREGDSLLFGKKEHRTAAFCELARTREMIGMDVCVEDTGDLPTVH